MTLLDSALMGTFGGILIGVSATVMMWGIGRVTGVSGIVSSVLAVFQGQRADGLDWRVAFIAGLLLAAPIFRLAGGVIPDIGIASNPVLLIAGGLLVGFGTVIGNGCTSGHGVCGLARLSPRSFSAVCVFLSTAIVVVYVSRHVLGTPS